MGAQTYYIRSVMVQNTVMGIAVAIIALLLIRFIMGRKHKHVILVVLWGLFTLCFFNAPFWGFSAVTVSPQGLKIDYGFLSVYKNTTLPPDTTWKIHVYMGGIRRMKKLYYFQLAAHKSLKVKGPTKLAALQSLGAAIDRLNGGPMGEMEERPVNR